MGVQSRSEALSGISFFRGLDAAEIAQVAGLCTEQSYKVGEICQTEGQPAEKVSIILKGRVGAAVHIPNVSYISTEIIIDSLTVGDIFGWSSLIKSTPWSTLRVLEPTEVLVINSQALLDLCESNFHIGYIIMRNLSSLIASRLRRNRMATLNALVAIRGV